MKRPSPTKPLLIELCGGDQGLISSAHHGLYESPLTDFYPYLDLDETVAFAASSWKSREKNPNAFSYSRDIDAYELFSQVYSIGFPWLNKHKNISPEQSEKHSRLNPFKGKNLQQRLEMLNPEAVVKLKFRLSRPVNTYVFDCQYHQEKMRRGGDNFGIEVMNFQAVYPRRGKIVPAFAAEVARLISKYPSEYELA